jgi:hypothetical protein
MRQHRREATASDPSSLNVYRREDFLATVQIQPVIFPLFRCKSSELLDVAIKIDMVIP